MESLYNRIDKVIYAKNTTGTIIRSLITIILIVVGVYLINYKNNDIQSGIATITKVNCGISRYLSIRYSCSLDITYIVNNKEYKGMILPRKRTISYTPGETIPISYEINNPSNVSELQPGYLIYGIICLIFGILWLFGAVF